MNILPLQILLRCASPFTTIFSGDSKIKFLILETFIIFAKTLLLQYFQTRFLEAADKFISELDPKAARKVLYNIDLAEQSNDPKLFKKLQKDIWEFRAKFGGIQIRLLAFWDKDKETETLVSYVKRF